MRAYSLLLQTPARKKRLVVVNSKSGERKIDKENLLL